MYFGVPADYILRFGYAARKWIIDTNQIPSWLVKGGFAGAPFVTDMQNLQHFSALFWGMDQNLASWEG